MKSSRVFLVSGLVVVALIYMMTLGGNKGESIGTLHLYCAANMRKSVEELAKKYFEKYKVTIEADYDGSGSLLGKLQAEARSAREEKRGDLYLAADDSYIFKAREKGLVAESLPVAYMRPVIAVQKGNPKGISKVEDLLAEGLKVAVCNPDQAAVGRSARRVLQESGHWDRLEKKVTVMKPKVTDLANDVKLGTVDAAIVWDSTVAMYPELQAIRDPLLGKERVNVTLGVVSSSRSPSSALRFARFLASEDEGLPVFRKNGFETPGGDPWEEIPELVVWSGGVNRLAIEESVKEFREREGVEVATIFGGCGSLTAQMKTVWDTPRFPDVYFACDRVYMDNVNDWYLSSEDVSETDMVILAPKDNPRRIRGLEDLGADGMRLGVADPAKSALGRLTVRLLKKAGLYEKVYSKVETRAGTADFLVNQIVVSEGKSLDAVIVYLANTARVRDKVAIVKIDHPEARAEQPIAISRISTRSRLARRFIDKILSPVSQERFENMGFRWQAGGKEGSE